MGRTRREVLRTGEQKLLDRLSDQQIDEITTKDDEREALVRNRFRSCLLLPLVAGGRVVGCVTLWIMRPANAFDEVARRTAKRLADRAALALVNARLHEQQAHIASVLQGSLRPRSLPEIAGFESSSRFLAAGEAYQVGGDFYDVFRTGSGAWTAVIGDVCGKARRQRRWRHWRDTRSAPPPPERAPSDVLRALHESITGERTDLRFCTAAIAHPDPGERRGIGPIDDRPWRTPPHPGTEEERPRRPARPAGHPARRPPDPHLADVDARLGVGDALVLYTDGMLDLADRTSDDDPDWLPKQLERAGGGGADEVASKLAEAAIKRNGGEPGRHRDPRPSPLRRRLAPAVAVHRPVRIGCSGWVSPDWRGRLYPRAFRSGAGSPAMRRSSTRSRSTAPSTGWPPPPRSKPGSSRRRTTSSSQ